MHYPVWGTWENITVTNFLQHEILHGVIFYAFLSPVTIKTEYPITTVIYSCLLFIYIAKTIMSFQYKIEHSYSTALPQNLRIHIHCIWMSLSFPEQKLVLTWTKPNTLKDASWTAQLNLKRAFSSIWVLPVRKESP